MFLVIFVLTGVGFTLARIANNAAGSAGLAALVVLFCQAFGTQQGRDMLPFSEQRHEHMDQAIQFIRQRVSPEDVILTDKATSLQLKFYLCDQKPVEVEHTSRGYETFQCSGLRVVSTSPDDGALTADVIASHSLSQDYGSKSRSLWVIQGGWASGLGEELRDRFPAFSQLQIHSFGRHMEVFRLSTAATTTPQP
jgi:hypothetical protein